ncbi:hypothetical protein Tco_0093776 [Tanacetum coccineum]
MVSQTRSNYVVTDEIMEGLRGPIALMMREEMKKLRDVMNEECNYRKWGYYCKESRGRCEQFFMVDNVPYGQKVSLVSIYLFDIALVWHRQFIVPLLVILCHWFSVKGFNYAKDLGTSFKGHLEWDK